MSACGCRNMSERVFGDALCHSVMILHRSVRNSLELLGLKVSCVMRW